MLASFQMSLMAQAPEGSEAGAPAEGQQAEAGAPAEEEDLSPVGFWQLCLLNQNSAGEVEMRLMPLLKIIDADGGYTEVLIRTTGGGCSVVTEATYTITSDTTMTVVTEASSFGGGPQGMPQRGAEGGAEGGMPSDSVGGAPMPQQPEAGEDGQSMPRMGEGGGGFPRTGGAQESTTQDIAYYLQGPQWMVVEYKAGGNRTVGVTEDGTVQEVWMRVGSNPRLKSVLREAIQGGDTDNVEQRLDQDQQRMPQRGGQGGQGARRGSQTPNTSSNSMYNQQNSWMDED